MVYQAKNKDLGGEGIEIKLRDKSQTVKVTRSARSFVESILSIDSRASLSLSLSLIIVAYSLTRAVD